MSNNIKGWVKILLLIIPFLIANIIFYLLGEFVLKQISPGTNGQLNIDLNYSIFSLIGTSFVLWLFMVYVDKRKFVKLGFDTSNRFKEFIVGILIGLTIMFLAYISLALTNQIVVKEIDFDFTNFIKVIFLFTSISIFEEMLFRGYILRNLMEDFNINLALFISAVLFSLAHGINPSIGWVGFIALFLAGYLLGISYAYTQNLWFPIALHLSWNLFQSLFGFNVSGQDTYSIIEFTLPEHNIINGGHFGFEGSILSIGAQLVVIIGINLYYQKKGEIVEY